MSTLHTEFDVEKWMSERSPSNSDALKLQWMRADCYYEPRIDPPESLQFALFPMSIDPMKYLPPLFLDPNLLDDDEPDNEECLDNLPCTQSVEFSAALLSGLASTPTSIYQRALLLREDEWISLLDGPLFTVNVTQLLCILQRAPSDVLVNLLLREDFGAFPRILRQEDSTFDSSKARKVASFFLRLSHLRRATPLEFRLAVARLRLQERAGDPGSELQTCLAEEFFQERS
jgi:hypothetical protein